MISSPSYHCDHRKRNAVSLQLRYDRLIPVYGSRDPFHKHSRIGNGLIIIARKAKQKFDVVRRSPS